MVKFLQNTFRRKHFLFFFYRDDEMDGKWEAPTIDNPLCKNGSNCGKWTPPLIPNPAYKGPWSAPLIDNLNYRVCQSLFFF